VFQKEQASSFDDRIAVLPVDDIYVKEIYGDRGKPVLTPFACLG